MHEWQCNFQVNCFNHHLPKYESIYYFIRQFLRSLRLSIKVSVPSPKIHRIHWDLISQRYRLEPQNPCISIYISSKNFQIKDPLHWDGINSQVLSTLLDARWDKLLLILANFSIHKAYFYHTSVSRIATHAWAVITLSLII